MTDWQHDLNRLADELIDAGKLRSPAWIEAFKHVPRHVFVPRFVQQAPTGWREVDTSTDEGWAAVYSNRGLFTALDDKQLGISSSSMPSLMMRMLEALEIQPDHRVLEIGTGTGYNAALLSTYLGDGNVYSVDIDFVDTAAQRLASISLQPTLATRDGREGFPEAAPFDRIIATCAVASIPAAWVQQLTPDGAILADLKTGRCAGNLVLLHRTSPNSVEGTFVSGWADFMQMRTGTTVPTTEAADHSRPHHSTTRITGRPWAHTVPWFLASFRLPAGIGFGMRIRDGQTWWTITSPDGSRAEVCDTGSGKEREVLQSGPHRLWDDIEIAFSEWEKAGQPAWDRFGLTVEPSAQVVWCLDSDQTWKLELDLTSQDSHG